MDLTSLTIREAHEGLKSGKFTSRELTQAFLDRIEKEDGKIGAYLAITKELALEQADKADERIKSGKDFPVLCGIPCAIKDNIMVKDQDCTAASKILEHYKAPYDATVIDKLKDQGAVILGKTNLDEFAMGGSTENSALGTTKNPHDLERVPGGSSGGSAAAVASNQAIFALGTDTGGSIRQPGSFCGVVGFKPTYGAVSRYGLMAFASSLDQAGPIVKNIEDAEIVFNAISGKDSMDSTSVDYNFKEEKVSLKGLKIGVPKEFFAEGINSEVEKITRDAIKKAESEGAEIIEISLPSTEYALACYYIIAPCEASSNLARYDGIRYGFSEISDSLLDTYLKSRGKGFGPEVKRRIMLGTYSLSSGYYDAYYKKAQEVRDLIKEDFKKAFEKVDVIFGPTSPVPAFKIGERTEDPLSMYLADIYTVAVNLAGLPALSMPSGKIGALPVGLHIIGNHFEDGKILGIASSMENVLKYN